MHQLPESIAAHNKKLEDINSLVNNILATVKNGTMVFYHLRSKDLNDMHDTALLLKCAHFNQEMQYLGNSYVNPLSGVLKEAVTFLNIKVDMEGKPEMVLPEDLDNYGAEFISQVRSAKAESSTPVITQQESQNLNNSFAEEIHIG